MYDSSCATTYHGIYKGKVVSVEDPLKMGRLTVKIPSITSADIGWCLPSQDSHDFNLPRVDQQVWIIFQNGQLRLPVWMPGWTIADEVDDRVQIDYPTNNPDRDTGTRMIKWGDHAILFGATNGNEYVLIGDRELQNFIKIQGGQSPGIELSTLGNVRINAQAAISSQSPGVEGTSQGNESKTVTGSYKLGAGELLELVGTGQIDISSNGNITVITSPLATVDIAAGATEADKRGIKTSPTSTEVSHLIAGKLDITAAHANLEHVANLVVKGKLGFIGTSEGNVSSPLVLGTQLGVFLQQLMTTVAAMAPISAAPGSPCVPDPVAAAKLAVQIAQINGVLAPFLSKKNFTE